MPVVGSSVTDVRTLLGLAGFPAKFCTESLDILQEKVKVRRASWEIMRPRNAYVDNRSGFVTVRSSSRDKIH